MPPDRPVRAAGAETPAQHRGSTFVDRVVGSSPLRVALDGAEVLKLRVVENHAARALVDAPVAGEAALHAAQHLPVEGAAVRRMWARELSAGARGERACPGRGGALRTVLPALRRRRHKRRRKRRELQRRWVGQGGEGGAVGG